MLLSLALCSLASPHASVAPAGFLRDARVALRSDQHLAFDARIQWPATITRRSFVVEGLGPDGALLLSRSATARVEASVGRQRGSVAAHFELELPPLAGVERWRVRCAP